MKINVEIDIPNVFARMSCPICRSIIDIGEWQYVITCDLSTGKVKDKRYRCPNCGSVDTARRESDRKTYKIIVDCKEHILDRGVYYYRTMLDIVGIPADEYPVIYAKYPKTDVWQSLSKDSAGGYVFLEDGMDMRITTGIN